MKRGPSRSRRWHILVTSALSSAVVACGGDGPTQPSSSTDVNPALAAFALSGGVVTSASSTIPQGSGTLEGPGGLAMDATAGEFVQKVTLADGQVLTVAGVHLWAVPDENAASPVVDRMAFGAANTGSLTRVGTGSYPIGPTPPFDFINPVPVYAAQVRATGDSTMTEAESGTFTIESIDYFPDTYSCVDRYKSGGSSRIVLDECSFQIGIIRGKIAFQASAAGVTQQETEFTLPIRYENLTAHLLR